MIQWQARFTSFEEPTPFAELSFRIGALLGQPPLIDATLHLFSATILPTSARRRFLQAGFSPADLDRTLREIRSLADWSAAWIGAARRQELRARAAELSDTPAARAGAARHWSAAALAYSFADAARSPSSPADHAALEAARLAAFHRAAPGLSPPAQAVTIPWPAAPLPGWLRRPVRSRGPLPLVVFFNGAGIVKEEMTLWSEPFLNRGLATLAFDGPGCGELRGRLATDRGQENITSAIVAWAAKHPALDASRVALLGVSFGGAQVMHHTARNPAVAACVSVTPPFHPPPYIDRVHPFVMEAIATLCGTDPAGIRARAADLSCLPFVDAVHCPTLVIGAGLDTILPPTEARRLYDALTCPKFFLYLRRASHIGLSHLDLWTVAAADWLAGQLMA